MNTEKESVPQSEEASPSDRTNVTELPGSHTVVIDGVQYAPIDGQVAPPPPYDNIDAHVPPVITQPTNSRL